MGRRGRLRGPGAVLLAIVVVACSSPAQPTVPPSTTPDSSGSAQSPAPEPSASAGTAPTPSSQALIATDLDSGAIDLPTSLELRAWALFGDPRLPERYDGTGSTGEDASLFDDIATNLESLPVDKQTELSRYLLRPTDARSPFSTATTATGAIQLAHFEVTTAQTVSSGEPCGQGGQWFYRDWTPAGGSANDGLRMWACAQNEGQTRADFDIVERIGAELWPKMTLPEPQGMGRPVPDAYTAGDGTPRGEGNGKVDLYLVDALAPCRQRGENCQTIAGDAMAVAPKDWPLHCAVTGFPEEGCSGYMVLGRGSTDDLEFPGVFAHEFFHVLQHAHNGKIPTTWYHEASATWAGWYYKRESYKNKAYDRFKAYQDADDSLLRYDYDGHYQYQAWGWPLFQYVEGGESNVFQAWAEIENAATPAQVDRAVDLQLPFLDGFREFTVANAQPAAYFPGTSAGLDDIRWQTHPQLTDFPTDEHHVTGPPKTIALGRMTVPADVAPLTAQYDMFQVLDDNIREIHIDLLGVSGADFVDLDAVAQIGEGDTWKRFRGVNGRLVFCRDKADQNVSGALEVVLSNHLFARDPTNLGFPDRNLHAKGDYLIQATEEQTTECNPNFVILHGRLTGDRDNVQETTHATFDFYIKWHRPSDWRDPLNMVFMSGDFTFMTTVHSVCGGTRSAGGHFEATDDFTQAFFEGDGLDHQVGATLSDQRADYGRIIIGFSADYEPPNDDPLCQPPFHGGISTCPLIWVPIDEETLPVAVSCTDEVAGSTWTATLVQE